MDEDIRTRLHSGRQDYTQAIHRSGRPVPDQPAAPGPTPAHPKSETPKKFLSRKTIIFLLGLIILAVAAGGWRLLNNTASGPLPKNVLKQASFPVYYPSSLPSGYILDKQSPSFDKKIVFFSLSNGPAKISISEQAAPANPPDFDNLQRFNTSFKKLELPGGTAIYGLSQKIPVSILLTNTTLVNINGSAAVPLDALAKITQSMSSDFSQD